MGNAIAHLLVTKKTSSYPFFLLYQMPELDVTTSLLVAEISKHLCISFIIRMSCMLCFVGFSCVCGVECFVVFSGFFFFFVFKLMLLREQ